MKKNYKRRFFEIFLIVMIIVQSSTFINAQNLKLTLGKSGTITIKELLSQIRKQTGYIFHHTDVFSVEKSISIPKSETTFDEAIKLALGDKYTYTKEDNNIIITEKLVEAKQEEKKERKIRIEGKVTDNSNEPLFGVNLVLWKSNKLLTGATSDINGNYYIETVEVPTLLELSYLGYAK
ncbi:MAG: carboxypeptidase-like regulatory domain-containing protein, partial [Flavobacterium sp.]|nr:carboxypeptidase-like regulatory domain-containing protein [Flavobacterium sp.]